MPSDSEVERRVWALLTCNFTWEIPAYFEVKLYGGVAAPESPAKLQVFEVIVAAIFARLRPEYQWYVTPNRPDGGLDFVGRHGFLEHEALGIAAAITVGGQCKKRTRVDDIVQEVAGSLVRMATTVNPTFFVVAFSARLDRDRVSDAQLSLERVHQRHCHILDRRQIEGLIGDHLPIVRDILREALADGEVRDIVDYFEAHRKADSSMSIAGAAPDRVLAGVPFGVTLSVRSLALSIPGSRLWWKPPGSVGAGAASITLIGPIGADVPQGFELVPGGAVDEPILASQTVELVTYSVGKVDLGQVYIGLTPPGTVGAAQWISLGSTQVIENVRPRFFDRPFRAGLHRLASAYDRTLAGAVAPIGVVGVGGSGKSRLCEEFALARRRAGATVVIAQQAKTLDEPHRILANLLSALVPNNISFAEPADGVVSAIGRYDPTLAERAAPAIRSIFGARAGRAGEVTDQSVLSSLLLLIVAGARRGPLIVHLQDLHWCTADVLLLIERLVWQLDRILSPAAAPNASANGVLFVFEGRVRERHGAGDDGWTSEPFEAFLQKLDGPVVRCSSFEPADGLEFIRRLFEDRYSTRRLVTDDLLELQQHLIDEIDRSAGGNPFHSLEQVQLLKERRILGQNPDTGLLYAIQPATSGPLLPDSVFEAIQLRWRYLAVRTPQLALLVWAAALLEDRVPRSLFNRLWRALAPDVSLGDVDATDMLWTGDGEHSVTFRHENYFRSIRRFEVSAQDRRRVVEVYADWFDGAERRDPVDRFRWARALLELPEPDVGRARKLLQAALRGARRDGDVRLVRRISATSLDLTWDEDARSAVSTNTFLLSCDRDLELIRDLMSSDRFQSEKRLDGLRISLSRRLTTERTRSLRSLVELRRRQLATEVLRSQILYNDRRPAMAAEVAARAVRGIRELRPDDPSGDDMTWKALEMEALHSQAVALALSGEIDDALRIEADAVDLARTWPSPLSYRVISSYANILLARDPAESESILRSCLHHLVGSPALDEVRYAAEVNLAMALVLRSYPLGAQEEAPRRMRAEARQLLTNVFASSYQVGRYLNAAAAALMLGVLSAIEDDDAEVSWFAQAVAAASRGHKKETLWRAHVNLATSLYRRQGTVSESVRDHARAAAEIMEETLSPYSDPDRSARFGLIRIPLAQAVRFLVMAGDEAGRAALVRYPGLRSTFQDAQAGVLRPDRGGYQSHEWLRIGGNDYVIY